MHFCKICEHSIVMNCNLFPAAINSYCRRKSFIYFYNRTFTANNALPSTSTVTVLPSVSTALSFVSSNRSTACASLTSVPKLNFTAERSPEVSQPRTRTQPSVVGCTAVITALWKQRIPGCPPEAVRRGGSWWAGRRSYGCSRLRYLLLPSHLRSLRQPRG